MEKDQNRIPDSDRDFDIGGDNESILENKNRRRAENAGNEYSAPVRRGGAEAQRPVKPTGSEETLKRSSAAGVQNRSGAASGQTRGAAGSVCAVFFIRRSEGTDPSQSTAPGVRSAPAKAAGAGTGKSNKTGRAGSGSGTGSRTAQTNGESSAA